MKSTYKILSVELDRVDISKDYISISLNDSDDDVFIDESYNLFDGKNFKRSISGVDALSLGIEALCENLLNLKM